MDQAVPANEPPQNSEKFRFIGSFTSIQSWAHRVNRQNGWWDDRHELLETDLPGAKPAIILSLLALAHSELSEAAEAVRKHPESTWGDPLTKDTLVRELGGTIVRIMDLAEAFNLPLADAIFEEIKANAERGFRHGGKRA